MVMKDPQELREEAKLKEARKMPGYQATLEAIRKLGPGEEHEYYQLPSSERVIALWPSGVFAAVRDAHDQGIVTPHQRRVNGKVLYVARRRR